MIMLNPYVPNTAEDPDFRSIGVNKTTNLSKELQFFEKVVASVIRCDACMHA